MLTKEVQELVESGDLHEYDAEWVGRLKPENQMTAAVKCMASNMLLYGDWKITDTRYKKSLTNFHKGKGETG